MRVTLADSTLTRQAGRFVWLALDYDKPVNQAFLKRHGVGWTPSFFVLDPADERVTATLMGGMTLAELGAFLDQGERGVRHAATSPVEAALVRGDACLGRGQHAEGIAAFREALALATTSAPERDEAIASLARALSLDRQVQPCTELASAEAPGMARERAFASVVLLGFASACNGDTAAWAVRARERLRPLAIEAAGLATALRDDRFQLDQQLMRDAEGRGDSATVVRVGHGWLAEIEATVPRNDDERSALDIARVDAASELGEPDRVLAALRASERAMPRNYNASLRHAQMADDAKHYPEALAACERGLAHVTGPVGRAWLLQTRADALLGQGDKAGARRALAQALASARTIGNAQNRASNLRRISAALTQLDAPAP